MNRDELLKKVRAAQELLAGNSTTPAKLKSAAALVMGINPKLDGVLKQCTDVLSKIEHIEDGSVIELSAEQLPETTDDEKKRKAALLLFIRTFKDVQSEVVRIQSELLVASSNEHTVPDTSLAWRIFSKAKGPLALVTIIAAGIATMSVTSADVTISNDGCGTLYASGGLPISIPGLSLPTEPIASGDSGTATIPPLSFTVDGTETGLLSLKAIGLSFSFNLSSSVTDVTFNGQSLIGTQSEIAFVRGEENNLAISCR